MQLQIIGVGISFLIVLITGVWLTRSGRPYSGLLLNVHKLIALAGVVLLTLVIRQQSQASALGPSRWAVIAGTGALLVASVATGGLVSLEKPPARALLILHRVLPFLAFLASAAVLYLLLAGP